MSDEELKCQVEAIHASIVEIRDQQKENACTLVRLTNALEGPMIGIPGLIQVIQDNDKRLKKLEDVYLTLSLKQGAAVSFVGAIIALGANYIIKNL